MPQQPAAVLQALSSGTVVHQKCSRRDGYFYFCGAAVELLCVTMADNRVFNSKAS
jgi:hypothetical protein